MKLVKKMAGDPYARRLLWFVFTGSKGGLNRIRLVSIIRKTPLNAFLHNVIGVYAYFSMTELYATALLPYLLAVHVAELAGILIFLKITLQ